METGNEGMALILDRVIEWHLKSKDIGPVRKLNSADITLSIII